MSIKQGYPFAVVILALITLIVGCANPEPGRTSIFVRAPTGTAQVVTVPPGTQPTSATPTPVSNPLSNPPTSTANPVPTVTQPTPEVTAEIHTPTSAPTTPPPAPGTSLVIQCIFFDGTVAQTESDEYVLIMNFGGTVVNLMGWRLQDVSDGSPELIFPSYELLPQASVRVYTDEVHRESGGFSFQRNSSIWNNSNPDTAGLSNPDGVLVSTKSYPPGC